MTSNDTTTDHVANRVKYNELNGKTKRFIEAAMNEAYKSDSQKRHGCVMVKAGKITAASANQEARGVLCGRTVSSMHAEMAVLSLAFRKCCSASADKENYRNKRKKQQSRKNRNRHLDIYVIRLGAQNELRNSRPCFECVKALKKLGVYRVFYSDENGNIRMEKVCDMENAHLSVQQLLYQTFTYPIKRLRF